MNDLVEIVTTDEVVIDLIGDFGVERQTVPLLFPVWSEAFQSDVTPGVYPFDFDLVPLPGFHLKAREVGPGQPILPPGVHNKLAIEPHLGVTATVEAELVHARFTAFDLSAPANSAHVSPEAFRIFIVHVDELMFDSWL